MDQGRRVSSPFTATAPTLAAVSPPLQAGHQHPDSAVLACWGGAGRRQGSKPQVSGKAWRRRHEEQGPPEPCAPRLSPHDWSLLQEKHGYSVLSVSPPPHLGPWVSAGVSRSLCQWHGAFWNVCLGSQGRLSLPVGRGMERKGYTQTRQTRGTGGALVGKGKGWGSAGVPGSWQGWHREELGQRDTWCVWVEGRGSRWSPGQRGHVPSRSGPGARVISSLHVPQALPSPPLHLLQKLSSPARASALQRMLMKAVCPQPPGTPPLHPDSDSPIPACQEA